MKEMRSLIIICYFIILSGSSIWGQNDFNKPKLDSLLDVYEQKNKLMLSMSIHKMGKTQYTRAIGSYWMNDTTALRSDPSTKYRIGSISKTFTAVLILQLIEEKKLKLNTPLAKFYPKFPNAKRITIEHLLQHRSGIHNFTDDPEYLNYMYEPKSHQQLMDIFEGLPSDFEPGTKHAYSNTNYVLLGFIVEKVTKKTYADVLLARICSKIGLTNTYYGGAANQLLNEARSFRFDGKAWQLENETDMSIPQGAGSLVATADELNLFVEGIFNYQLLSEQTVNQMILQVDGYGMGIFAIPFYDRTAFGHNGRLDGFESTMAYFPDDQVSFSLSANAINADLNEFIVAALSIYFNKPYDIPNFYTYPVSNGVLTKYAGVYHSNSLQLDFYIIKEGSVITGQAEGQTVFPLEAKSETTFTYDPAKLEIEFIKGANDQIDQFVLRQSGMEFVFVKLE